MNTESIPKRPMDKSDPAYMRAAYLYSAIFLLLGLLASALLAGRITTAEKHNEALNQQKAVQSVEEKR